MKRDSSVILISCQLVLNFPYSLNFEDIVSFILLYTVCRMSEVKGRGKTLHSCGLVHVTGYYMLHLQPHSPLKYHIQRQNDSAMKVKEIMDGKEIVDSITYD